MRLKAIIAITVTTLAIGGATATLFDFSASLDKIGALKMAPMSIGHPASAATLATHTTPSPFAEQANESSRITPIPIVNRTVTLKRGNTLSGVLTDAGLSGPEAAHVVEAFADAQDPRRIKAGQQFDLRFQPDSESGLETFVGLTYEPTPREVVTVTREGDSFSADKEQKQITPVDHRADGVIDNSLYMAGARSGLPVSILTEMIHAYSWDVDFQRSIRAGDKFAVLYQSLEDNDGDVVGYGNIEFAQLTLSGRVLSLYRFKTDDGTVSYFNDKGQSARKALLRTPVDGARISSGFGMRKNPVLGYTKMHKGIDFAVPRGTPVYAAGDGVVQWAGRKGAYGNLLQIRHNAEYQTRYGHLNGFAKGIHPGVRVRQGEIVAYVGSTGRSTGPHVHFEILKNGRQVNPMKVQMPSGRKLAGKELQRFLAQAQEIQQHYAQLTPETDVASR